MYHFLKEVFVPLRNISGYIIVGHITLLLLFGFGIEARNLPLWAYLYIDLFLAFIVIDIICPFLKSLK
jgi:hypothetical protein